MKSENKNKQTKMTKHRADLSPTIGKSSQIRSSFAIQLIQDVVKKKCLLFFTSKFWGDLLHSTIVTSAV